MDATPYHRVRHASRWRGLAEVPITLAFMFAGMIGVMIVVFAAAGAPTLEELDEVTSFVVLMSGLAMLCPAALLTARILNRPPGTLSSVAGRMRWRWLASCVLIAAFVHAIPMVPWAIASAAGENKDLAWPGWDAFAPMAAAIVLVVPLQATGEEYFFRGTLVQAIGAWAKTPWIPIVLSAAAFCAIHMAPLEASVAIFAMGVIDAWLTVRTGGLEAAIATHTMNNVYAFMMVTISGQSTNAETINQEVDWVGVVVQFALHLLYAWWIVRRYRRTFEAV